MTREENLVSVVIPAYRSAAYIRTTLNSVLSQSFQGYEILVVNDGSPDTDLLEQALAPYSGHIRYFRRPHSGPSAARNFGILESRGKYVAFLDSDDFWLPEHLTTHMSLLQGDPALGLVYGDSFIVKGDQVVARTFELESQVLPITFEALLREDCTVTTSTTVASRTALIEAGLFDEHMNRCEDFDLWLRMAMNGTPMTRHSQPTACRALMSDGLSANGYAMKCARIAVFSKILKHFALTEEQQQQLASRRKFTEAMAHLDRFKVCIQSGDFQEALDSGRVATSILPGKKLRAAVTCLEHAPQAVRLYYRVHERALAIRNRKRVANSSRTWTIPLPPPAVTAPGLAADPRFSVQSPSDSTAGDSFNGLVQSEEG